MKLEIRIIINGDEITWCSLLNIKLKCHACDVYQMKCLTDSFDMKYLISNDNTWQITYNIFKNKILTSILIYNNIHRVAQSPIFIDDYGITNKLFLNFNTWNIIPNDTFKNHKNHKTPHIKIPLCESMTYHIITTKYNETKIYNLFSKSGYMGCIGS